MTGIGKWSDSTAGTYVWSKSMQVCGVTSVEDCELAARSGADLVGMIMWPKAARSVSDATAAAICARASELGAKAVGVFVDETPAVIAARAKKAGLAMVQLHGDGARQGLHDLPESIGVVYVMHATPEGVVQTPLPSAVPHSAGQEPRRVRSFCCQ